MTQRILVRPMKFTDIAGMIRVNEASLPENYPRSYWESLYHLNHASNHSFVACSGVNIIGYVLCMPDAPISRVVSLAVQAPYRGMGIGKALLETCLNTFQVGKVTKVGLQVRKSNAAAIKLYESHGFEADDVLPNYYNNPIEDAYAMTRPVGVPVYPDVRKLKVTPWTAAPGASPAR